jgi:hypothetical protein
MTCNVTSILLSFLGFVALWTCGCVFSERALKKLNNNVCSICQTPYTEQDIVILNGNEEDIDLMATKMELRVARQKAEKKEKKKSKTAEETVVKIEPGTSSSTAIAPAAEIKKTKLPTTLKPQIAAHKRELLLDPLASDPNSKKVKKDYSVAKDEKATEVYKSLFTSHDSEKKQERGHWVTYNPHYY